MEKSEEAASASDAELSGSDSFGTSATPKLATDETGLYTSM